MRARTELPELLTADEVAAWLKTTRKAIYAKAERGSLPGATYIGRRLYFLQADLLRCVAQGRVPNMGDSHGGT
jgi:hypothetical protein